MADEPQKVMRQNPETGEWEDVENTKAWRYDSRRQRWEYLTEKELEGRHNWRMFLFFIVAGVVYASIGAFINLTR